MCLVVVLVGVIVSVPVCLVIVLVGVIVSVREAEDLVCVVVHLWFLFVAVSVRVVLDFVGGDAVECVLFELSFFLNRGRIGVV